MQILIDTDGVLSDFVEHAIVYLRKEGFILEKTDCTDYALTKNMSKDCARAFKRLPFNPTFCFNVPRNKFAQSTLKKLVAKGHNISLVTSLWESPYWEKARTEWFESLLSSKELTKIETFFVTPQERVHMPGDILVEDRRETLVEWAASGRKSFLIDQPWNAGTLPDKSTRLANLSQILEYL